jgi:hypothetical protein
MIQRHPEEAERYSIPRDKPLSDLITDSVAAGMRNMIYYWLAADLDIMSLTKGMEIETFKHYYPESEDGFRRPDLQDHQLFELAINHLSKFAFVGLTEKYEESLLLMCYIFGWKLVRHTVSHEPTRQRERQMRRFQTAGQAQRFLKVYGAVGNLFRLGHHVFRVTHYREFRLGAFLNGTR